MRMRQARRIVAAYVAGLLADTEALYLCGLSEGDEDRLIRAVEDLCSEMRRRSGRKDLTTATLGGLIADELART